MLAVRFDSKKVIVGEVPEPKSSDVLVRVRGCGICGSDLTILDSGFQIAGIPGHEISGELEDGTPVAIEPKIAARWDIDLSPGTRIVALALVMGCTVLDVIDDLRAQLAASLQPCANGRHIGTSQAAG